MTPVLPLHRMLAALLALGLLAACEWSALLDPEEEIDGVIDDEPPALNVVAGLDTAPSSRDFTTTYSFLRNRLIATAGTRIVAQVDHGETALRLGRELPPTATVMFAIPTVTAPLVQADPLAALDLPPTMLIYQDAGDDVAVAFNDPDYLRARYDIADRDEALAALDETLTRLAQDTASNAIATRGATAGVSDGEGIVIRDSAADFATTVTRLRNAINTSVGLGPPAVVNYRANAANLGLSVNPAALFVFTYPQAVVPLLQAAQTVAVDLPLKILVYQTNMGEVRVAYNDPDYFAARHGIADREQALSAIATVLGNLAEAATVATR